MRVLFAGTPHTAVTALNQLVEAGGDVVPVGVLTREDAPVGRKKVLTPSPVAQRAEELGLPILKANRLGASAQGAAEVREQIRELAPDIVAVVAYGALIPSDLLGSVPHGWVNLHFSLLPAYRGAAPVQRAIMDHEFATGVSIFQIETGLDTGPVFVQDTYEMQAGQTAGEVLEELAVSGGALLADTLGRIVSGELSARAQDEIAPGQEPSWAPKLTGRDGLVDPADPARESAQMVAALINGTIPEPGPWGYLVPEGEAAPQRLKFGAVMPVSADTGGHRETAGRIALVGKAAYLWCADGSAVQLSQVQPAGKKMMNVTDWLRGQGDKTVQLASSQSHPELWEGQGR